MDLGSSVGQVTVKLVYATTRKSEGTKHMKYQDVGNEVKSRGQIKINGITLTLRADQGGDTIKINYQISGGEFGFCETMLIRV